jgi:hypothetical protein
MIPLRDASRAPVREDIRDAGVHYVKRQLLKAIAMAAAAGLMVGIAAAWMTGRFRQERTGKC